MKIENETPESQNVHQRASLSLDNFWWRVGQGSHIQQAPHPPGKHVWGEALILDSLTLKVCVLDYFYILDLLFNILKMINICHVLFVQGSLNRPHIECCNQPPSLTVESSLKGLQVELSETCALCLTRLLSLVVPHGEERQLSEVVASAHVPDDSAVQPITTSQLHFLFKLDCCLEDVNVFTLSNLAGGFI